MILKNVLTKTSTIISMLAVTTMAFADSGINVPKSNAKDTFVTKGFGLGFPTIQLSLL